LHQRSGSSIILPDDIALAVQIQGSGFSAELLDSMLFKTKRHSAGLSVVAIFFNMPREAERTLHSLSKDYQGIEPDQNYEVHVIDNGSTEPLSAAFVDSIGEEFRYHFVKASSPAPCDAINRFVAEARFDDIMVLIDGARILSPGIARLTFAGLSAFPHPFIYTLGMHLGPKPQNYLVNEGYNQSVEDQLLQSVDWKGDGYSLFSISSPALSSKRGFFSEVSESNCFTLRKSDFVELGLYESRFQSPGGGLCNLELFNRINSCDRIQPVMLLGEATFHQFHGGVATNVPIEQHPWESMAKEYTEITGEPYENKFRRPVYLGSFREECAHLYDVASRPTVECSSR
jgi:glycosyltransferase involved in cell wall biosynthesis